MWRANPGFGSPRIYTNAASIFPLWAVNRHRRRVTFNKMADLRRWMPVASILGAGIAFGYPFLLRGMHVGHDSLEHLQRYSCVVEQLWSGELYPRWLTRMNAGLGSPIMFVYAPLPYYIPALLRPLLPLSAVHNRESLELGFSVWLALLLSGFTAFAWLKKLASPLAASASAILYMLMPYHLSIDLYARDAVGEMWAFVWIPMALRFCADLLEGDSPVAGLGLSVSYALLIYSHLLIALLFTPVLVAMFLFLPRRQ